MILEKLRTTKRAPGIRNKPHEVWAEFEGYLISNKGRWFSYTTHNLLAQNENSSGYSRASLSINGKRKHYFTHIKVVEMFGDCKGRAIPEGAKSLIALGLSIDHLNSNKSDNRQDNLEIVTHKENCLRRDQRISQQGGKLNGSKNKPRSRY